MKKNNVHFNKIKATNKLVMNNNLPSDSLKNFLKKEILLPKISNVTYSHNIGNIFFIKNTMLGVFSSENKINIFHRVNFRCLKRIHLKKKSEKPWDLVPKFQIINSSKVVVANDLKSIKIYSIYTGKLEHELKLPEIYSGQSGFLERVAEYILNLIMVIEIAPMIIGFTTEFKGHLSVWNLNNKLDGQPKEIKCIECVIKCEMLSQLDEENFALISNESIVIYNRKTIKISYKSDNGIMDCTGFEGCGRKDKRKAIISDKNNVMIWDYHSTTKFKTLRKTSQIIQKMIIKNGKVYLHQRDLNSQNQKIVVLILHEESLNFLFELILPTDQDIKNLFIEADHIYFTINNSLQIYFHKLPLISKYLDLFAS